MEFGYFWLLALLSIVLICSFSRAHFEESGRGIREISEGGTDNRTHLSTMHKLVEQLLLNYDTSVIPTPEYGLSLDINHLLILNSIVQLDSKVSKLTQLAENRIFHSSKFLQWRHHRCLKKWDTNTVYTSPG